MLTLATPGLCNRRDSPHTQAHLPRCDVSDSSIEQRDVEVVGQDDRAVEFDLLGGCEKPDGAAEQPARNGYVE